MSGAAVLTGILLLLVFGSVCVIAAVLMAGDSLDEWINGGKK